jgi:hypothetical protein
MLSDARLENVERLVSESLNEDASLQRVCPLSDVDQGEPVTIWVRQVLARSTVGCTP